MNLSLLSLTVSFLLASSATVRAEEGAFEAFAEGLTAEQIAERMVSAKEAVHQGDSVHDNLDFESFDFGENFWEGDEAFSSWSDSDEDL